MPALCIWTPEDGLLAAVAPLALGAAAPTALVVDLDPLGPRYPGSASLASLVAEQPRRDDLMPGRRGLAVLPNGGVEPEAALGVVGALLEGWPHVVLRLPPRPAPDELPAPVVPVHPLLPGALRPRPRGPAVYQRTGYPVAPPGPGPVLPVPRRSVVEALLRGSLLPLDRWVRSWRAVWSWPWE